MLTERPAAQIGSHPFYSPLAMPHNAGRAENPRRRWPCGPSST